VPTLVPDMSRYVARLEHDLERAEKERLSAISRG
jgi:hypothetical protein